MLQSRVLDNQDRVFRCETDERNDADLRVDVVRVRSNPYADQGAKQTKRHSQHHSKRDGPTFVLSREKQEHENGGKAENKTFLAFRKLLLEDGSAPLETESFGQVCLRDFFHR